MGIYTATSITRLHICKQNIPGNHFISDYLT